MQHWPQNASLIGRCCESDVHWSVEVRIPWAALQGSFISELFPPAIGDQVGFSLLGIDYDSSVLEWMGCIENAPWTGQGLQTMTFVQQ